MTARFLVGDVRDVLATLPDDSVDMIFTSPPFLALRSYLPADHPDKGKEIGSESDPGAFIDTLLGVTEDLARVLAPHGSLCVELGDTYSGSGGAGGDYHEDGMRDGQPKFRQVRVSPDEPDRGHNAHARGTTKAEGEVRVAGGAGWPLAKSACQIPELYRIALAYGRNPLTGRETPLWRVRNTIRWCRPNPPVGALGDKFRPATSEIVVACKGKDRYFDLDAVRTPHQSDPALFSGNGYTKGAPEGVPGNESMPGNANGAPPLDWWKIPTHGYPGSHYATFPPALVTIPLLAMCPLRVCRVCGQPSRRIVDPTIWNRREHPLERVGVNAGGAGTHGARRAEPTTLGWSDCECMCGDCGACRAGVDCRSKWRPGLILDPFGGSGTVAEVATGHGRDAILIDIDERNVGLARQRVGMFLEVA